MTDYEHGWNKLEDQKQSFQTTRTKTQLKVNSSDQK